jgi:hypothetical protein
VVKATFDAASFRKCSIPAVGAFDVVEHLADDSAFFRGVHEKLVPWALSSVVGRVHSWELSRRRRLPFGSSLLCVAIADGAA